MTNQTQVDKKLQSIFRWATAGFAILAGIGLSTFLILQTVFNPNFKEILHQQIRAVVGIPLASLVAFCLVTVLQVTSGHIEFSGLGFTFKGASGPVVLWALCFMFIVGAIAILWS